MSNGRAVDMKTNIRLSLRNWHGSDWLPDVFPFMLKIIKMLWYSGIRINILAFYQGIHGGLHDLRISNNLLASKSILTFAIAAISIQFLVDIWILPILSRTGVNDEWWSSGRSSRSLQNKWYPKFKWISRNSRRSDSIPKDNWSIASEKTTGSMEARPLSIK